MPSKKSANQSDSVKRLRDLLGQLRTVREYADDLSERARREVGVAMGNSGLLPADPEAAPRRRVRRKQKKR